MRLAAWFRGRDKKGEEGRESKIVEETGMGEEKKTGRKWK